MLLYGPWNSKYQSRFCLFLVSQCYEYCMAVVRLSYMGISQTSKWTSNVSRTAESNTHGKSNRFTHTECTTAVPAWLKLLSISTATLHQ